MLARLHDRECDRHGAPRMPQRKALALGPHGNALDRSRHAEAAKGFRRRITSTMTRPLLNVQQKAGHRVARTSLEAYRRRGALLRHLVSIARDPDSRSWSRRFCQHSDAESCLRYAWRTAASCGSTRSCPTAGKLRIAEWPRQSIKRVLRIIPFVRQIPRVQKSFVDRVPQLAGSKFMKFTDHPALKLVSGPIGQAGCNDGLDDLRPCPVRFDEFPVHPRMQMSRVCWASSRGSFRFD
jgi:hypothetical protein